MAKKMTCKEFKQILAEAGTDFESMGWEGILNSISGWYAKCGEDMEKVHLDAGAKRFHDQSRSIYKALESRGYYDDTKIV